MDFSKFQMIFLLPLPAEFVAVDISFCQQLFLFHLPVISKYLYVRVIFSYRNKNIHQKALKSEG